VVHHFWKGFIPRKLISHLIEVRGFQVELFEDGIYYIKGDIFPIQLIITSKLSKKENFWLRNLTDDLPDYAAVEELAKEYHEHRKNTLYRSVMNVIVKANEELFREESDMCEAIIDLFRDEYDKGVEEAKQLGISEGIQQGAIQQLAELVRDGLLTLEQAVLRAGLSEEEFNKILRGGV